MSAREVHRWLLVGLVIWVASGTGTGCSRRDAAEHSGHEGHDHAASGSVAVEQDSANQVTGVHRAAGDDWCAEHQIAESRCPFCDTTAIETGGWCQVHGVPAALCYQCEPQLVAAFQAVGDWCAEHDRPESQCYVCSPWLAPESPMLVGATAGVIATEDGDPPPNRSLPRSRRRPSVACTKQNLTVTFARPEIADEVGLAFATVEVRPLTRTLECNAVVAYDGNLYAQLAPQVPGIVTAVAKDLGDAVVPGEVLATITSPAFGAAKATYLQAAAAVKLWQQNHVRETDLLRQGVATERDLLEAETRLAESRIDLSRAEQELLGLGLTPPQIDALQRNGDTTARYQLTAPFAGVIVERQAVIGELFERSQPLFAVADVSRMWALLDVYESDVREIQVGQPVVLHVAGMAGEPVAGEITWISSQLDPRTRTLTARAEIENGAALLRANMFARAVVMVRRQQPTLVVPRAAVQWEGCCNVVFVRRSATTFQPRKVYLGPATGAFYEVIGGVAAGDVVVTQGSFLLKTEILKSNIGAGCCEVQPGS